MNYITGIDRTQSTLFPEVLDDYIDKNNPIRFIDAFVNSLDLPSLGFTHNDLNHTGRPPYHPADLLRLYIYGYLNRIRSSRQLEQATYRNLEVLWLMRRLQPDHKTIANFRKDNLKPLQATCRLFNLLCKDLGLFGGELVGIDGSKFAAVNHNSRHYTKKKLTQMLVEIDVQIANFLGQLDANDQQEVTRPEERNQLQEKIALIQQHKIELESLQAQLVASEEKQIAMTDPDSRMMRTGNGGNDMSYNVQIAVDDKHKLIVAHDVISDVNDRNALVAIAQEAKEFLGKESIEVVADKGYYNQEAIKTCQEADINCYVPIPEQPNGGLYTQREFQYEKTKDQYRCPAGAVLVFMRSEIKEKKEMRVYEGIGCGSCVMRARCTRSKEGNRTLTRWEHEHIIEELRERLAREPEKVAKRKCLVEHPFGTLKHSMDQRYVLLRGKEKVSAEISMSVMAYNMKRVLSILGVEKLIEILQARIPKEKVESLFIFAFNRAVEMIYRLVSFNHGVLPRTANRGTGSVRFAIEDNRGW